MKLNGAHLLMQLLKEQNLSTVFQPIFDLANSCILGYEALTRGPKDHPLEFPNQLFLAAEQQGKVSELELLCRKKAIENFAMLGLTGKLFLNVSPRTLLDPNHPKGETQHLLEQHGLNAGQVVIEVTEQDEVPNHRLLQQTLAYYRECGFSIAIDDLGVGHSGLRKWSELEPNIVKIDKYFIDHCHQSIVKKEFLKSIIDLAKATNTHVIAEGIEHQEELDLLTTLGVSLAQGFLLERPSADPSRVFSIDFLAKQARKQQGLPDVEEQTIGLLVEQQQSIFKSTHCSTAQNCFDKNKGLISLVVLNEQQQPVGMLHRDQLAELFAAPYGHALYDKKSVTRVMDMQPLIVDASDTLDMVSQQITDCDFDIRRHIVVTENQVYLGVVPLRKILKHITDQKVRHAQHANPLTMLPGNVAITQAIELRIKKQQNFFLAYVDLNHFKQFNDLYGYASGDAVIKLLAEVISESCDTVTSFVGHIGGDDFMVIFDGTDAWDTCQLIIKEFERRSHSFFTPEHIAAGGYWAPNREGENQFVPLLTLSVGLVNPDFAFCENSHQVAALATDAKKEAKRYRESYLFLCHRRKPTTPIVRMRLASGAD